ncbi:DEHA2E17754p [Debaryomyces hansenii CBS767]|uniref:DEHA2E17754p n=1 Tax=Debaryomyces hansenii (strain ATCC 36239 / CBS 767 / BCRC 21394 / JCM 1990 / NBRC 0083 / IGC 2968) TaxID=284592 RepID=Q6BNZ8_DEBHA|nr:DEHA2E17754p [Debaryomyces hansenii CBS767]CAG88332.2 DEHA2E17754p [Debaryomyces hansenii CBS767]|eukprot:XP_460072.2 DEHA2E17754p [Debaryomyces hansenii CBS767]
MTQNISGQYNKPTVKENSEPGKKNNRIFRGNPNYVNFLNREVKEFFQNKLINTYDEKPYFQESKINSRGMVLYKRDKDFENGGGTIWTNNQKEVFFNCLARYSIHQIDAICDNLPDKSAIEIMNYYDCLAHELKRLKRQVVKRRKYHKVKIVKDEQEVEYRFKSLPNRKNLIKYENIPAAYEMSEKFIRMEEIQAEMISQRERSKTNDENQRFKRQFNEYTISKRQKKNRNESNIPEDQAVAIEEAEDEKTGLINYDTACELSRSLYSNNKITPLHNNKLVPKLHYKSLVLFDQIARLTTEKILLKILEHKIVSLWLNQRQIPFEDDTTPLKIAHGDIYRAINSLNLFEIPKSGYQSLKKAGGRSMRINNYFSQLPERLNVEIRDNIDSKEKFNLSNKSYKKMILNDTDRVYGERFKPEFFNNEFTSIDNLNQKESEPKNSDPISIPHISSLPNSNPTIMNEIRLTNHKNTNELEEQIESELVRLEVHNLEEHDSHKSNIYEHSLFTYLTSFNKDDESVKDSMYNKDEAEAILAQKEDSETDSDSPYDQETNEDVGNFNTNGISLHVEEEGENEGEEIGKENNNEEQTEPTIMITKSLFHNFNYKFANYDDDSD